MKKIAIFATLVLLLAVTPNLVSADYCSGVTSRACSYVPFDYCVDSGCKTTGTTCVSESELPMMCFKISSDAACTDAGCTWTQTPDTPHHCVGTRDDIACSGLSEYFVCADFGCTSISPFGISPCSGNYIKCSTIIEEYACAWMACDWVEYEYDCEDGVDNDGDGDTDCSDHDCSNVVTSNGMCTFSTEGNCDDNFDNDGDGDTDCEDLNCDGRANALDKLCNFGIEVDCGDKFDNDGDRISDCKDREDCDGKSCGDGCVCSGLLETESTCSDSVDNDYDDLVDCDDQDCYFDEVCNNYDVDIDGIVAPDPSLRSDDPVAESEDIFTALGTPEPEAAESSQDNSCGSFDYETCPSDGCETYCRSKQTSTIPIGGGGSMNGPEVCVSWGCRDESDDGLITNQYCEDSAYYFDDSTSGCSGGDFTCHSNEERSTFIKGTQTFCQDFGCDSGEQLGGGAQNVCVGESTCDQINSLFYCEYFGCNWVGSDSYTVADAKPGTVYTISEDKTSCGSAPIDGTFGTKANPYPFASFNSGDYRVEWACVDGLWSKCQTQGQVHCKDNRYTCYVDKQDGVLKWGLDQDTSLLLGEMFSRADESYAESTQKARCENTFENIQLARGGKLDLYDTDSKVTYVENDEPTIIISQGDYSESITLIDISRIMSTPYILNLALDGETETYLIDLLSIKDDGRVINMNLCHYESSATEICDDGIDNDGDGDTDCEDLNCQIYGLDGGTDTVCYHFSGDLSYRLRTNGNSITHPKGVDVDVDHIRTLDGVKYFINQVGWGNAFWASPENADVTANRIEGFSCAEINDEYYICVDNEYFSVYGICKDAYDCDFARCDGETVENEKYVCWYDEKAGTAPKNIGLDGEYLIAKQSALIPADKYGAFNVHRVSGDITWIDQFHNADRVNGYSVAGNPYTVNDIGWLLDSSKHSYVISHGYLCTDFGTLDEPLYACYYADPDWDSTGCTVFDCEKAACVGKEQDGVKCYYEPSENRLIDVYNVPAAKALDVHDAMKRISPTYLEVDQNIDLFDKYLSNVVNSLSVPEHPESSWVRKQGTADMQLREWMADHLSGIDRDEDYTAWREYRESVTATQYDQYCKPFGSWDSGAEWYICTLYQDVETLCKDGLDNDLDGDIDVDDEDCGLSPENTAYSCSNSIDDDNDGLINCADPDCAEFDFCRCNLNGCEVAAGNYFHVDSTCLDRTTAFLYCGLDDGYEADIDVEPDREHASCVGHNTHPVISKSLSSILGKTSYMCSYTFCESAGEAVAAKTTKDGVPYYTRKMISNFELGANQGELYDREKLVIKTYKNSVNSHGAGGEALGDTGCYCEPGYYADYSNNNLVCSPDEDRLNPVVLVEQDGSKIVSCGQDSSECDVQMNAIFGEPTEVLVVVSQNTAIDSYDIMIERGFMPTPNNPIPPQPIILEGATDFEEEIAFSEFLSVNVISNNADGSTGSTHIMVNAAPMFELVEDECSLGQMQCVSNRKYVNCVQDSTTNVLSWATTETFCDPGSEGEYCDDNTNSCVACLADGDCGNDETCDAGTCVEDVQLDPCTDSDGGQDYYVQGTLTGDAPGLPITESCYLFETSGAGSPVTECSGTDTRCKVHEHWCEGSTVKAEEHYCENGCEDGACKEASYDVEDITGDGFVNIFDVMGLANAVMNHWSDAKYDATGDGFVNIFDVMRVANVALQGGG
jgi:hypothetical protein